MFDLFRQGLVQGLHVMQAVDFKKGLGCDKVGVLDMGAGSGLLSMMAARYRHTTNPPPL